MSSDSEILDNLRAQHTLVIEDAPETFGAVKVVSCSCSYHVVRNWKEEDGDPASFVPCPTFRILNGLDP